jgi:predicted Rossmann fold flavoprotein
MAAGTAAVRGHAVTVVERNALTGRKLRISGKGRCNLTNDTDVAGLLAGVPGNPRFLKHAFYRFSAQATQAFFTERGLPLQTERGARVFPVSNDADDVARVLESYCLDAGVHFLFGVRVQHVVTDKARVVGLETGEGRFRPADAVILATGGASYPGTGSTGDGYRIAEALGHTIVPLRAALVPLETVESWPGEVQGLSLRNVTLTATAADGRRLYREQGELLFTHYGLSGPLALTASRAVGEQPGCRLTIDLKPALEETRLDARILRDFAANARRQYRNALGDLLPTSLIPVIVRLSGIPDDRPVHQITREQRARLVRLLKELPLTVKRPRPLAEAIVTAGGVNVREVHPLTMASKRVAGLSFAGEVLDVDGVTGGYNLQIAWSTGHLAGDSIG